MEDEKIVELYWQRSEQAIAETASKYGPYCHYISYNILHSHEDAEECVNDTYAGAWNAMPPHQPNRLAAFLGKITRNLSTGKSSIRRSSGDRDRSHWRCRNWRTAYRTARMWSHRWKNTGWWPVSRPFLTPCPG